MQIVVREKGVLAGSGVHHLHDTSVEKRINAGSVEGKDPTDCVKSCRSCICDSSNVQGKTATGGGHGKQPFFCYEGRAVTIVDGQFDCHCWRCVGEDGVLGWASGGAGGLIVDHTLQLQRCTQSIGRGEIGRPWQIPLNGGDGRRGERNVQWQEAVGQGKGLVVVVEWGGWKGGGGSGGCCCNRQKQECGEDHSLSGGSIRGGDGSLGRDTSPASAVQGRPVWVLVYLVCRAGDQSSSQNKWMCGGFRVPVKFITLSRIPILSPSQNFRFPMTLRPPGMTKKHWKYTKTRTHLLLLHGRKT